MVRYKKKKIIEYSKRGLKLGRKIRAGRFNFGGRIKEYSIEEIRNIIDADPAADHFLEPELLGERKIKTRRAKVFLEKGFDCVETGCDVKGLYFAIDLDTGGGLHLDLYGVDEGEDMILTIDHIHPKSKGGKNRIENYQTMCLVCNMVKSNKV